MVIANAYGATLLQLTEQIAKLTDMSQEAREVSRHLFAIVRELPADLSDLDPFFATLPGDHWLWD